MGSFQVRLEAGSAVFVLAQRRASVSVILYIPFARIKRADLIVELLKEAVTDPLPVSEKYICTIQRAADIWEQWSPWQNFQKWSRTPTKVQKLFISL